MSIDTDRGVGLKVGLDVILGQISQTMGSVSQGLDRIHQYMTANPRQSPIVRPLAGSVVSDGSTYVFISLGGPSAGRVWDIRRLATWKGAGADPFATVTGVNVIACVFAGNVTNKGASSITSMIDLGFGPGQVPNDGTWSAHQFTIRFQQQLVLIYKGSANNDQYVATGQAEEYLESSPERIIA